MYDNLFAPLTIRGLSVKNRVAMSPMNRNAAPEGIVGENIAKFYRRRVDGDVGLIFTGGIAVDHSAATGVYVDRPCAIPELKSDAQIAGWKRVVDLVHEGGGKIVAQLWHLGVMRTPGTGFHPNVPSARPSGIYGPTDRPSHVERAFIERLAVPGPELTDAEIIEIIEGYARTARNAVALGFDGLEIHGANGYLPDSFLWDETNRRTDRWGGNRRERTRFAAELIRALRREGGESMPVFYRMSQWKHQDDRAQLATTAAELEDVVGPLADAGVDLFDCSEHNFNRPVFAGSNLNLAGWAKKLTGCRSMTVGAVGMSVGHYDPDSHEAPQTANNLDALSARFANGEFDLFACGRSLLNDPDWPRKARAGEAFVPWDNAAIRGVAR